jgi:hypothetical protein
MKAYVVDTNVPVVANGVADHAPPDCVLSCLDCIEKVKKTGIVLLDTAQLILKEYMNNLSLSGQPGAGDAFLRWVWINQANPRHCEIVPITPNPFDENDFEEFPNDPNLHGFDPSDRKFVAVAISSGKNPQVLNAVDTDWWNFREALRNYGVRIKFLCPDMMEE